MNSELLELPEITEKQVELFEAVGITKKSDLRDFEMEQLRIELTDANGFLQICDKIPEPNQLQTWLGMPGKNVGEEVPVMSEAVRTSEKTSPKQSATRGRREPETKTARGLGHNSPDGWPEALTVPVSKMVGSGLALQAIPAARVVAEPRTKELKEESGESDEAHKTTARPQGIPPVGGNGRPAVPGHKDLRPRGRGVTTTVRPETNQGRSEHSRSFIRGVRYPRVGDLVLAALSTVLLFFFFPLAVISGVMLIFTPASWFLIAPIGLVVSGLLYLIFGLKPRCRICGQGILVSKSCHRHKKAHHIPIIGYILPTALQMLIFRWFRCIYCGTSIRLKE